ncbi:MAG: 50S ribosomal protein L25/general stress protein Ctc [Actinomycetota bacterium]|nr:50S ribosomal protein L25/general stress protein Ctc [Actinomycetota bacterium]
MERKLQATKREAAGKGAARKSRAAGRVPGVLYGHGMEPVAVDVDARDLFHILHTEAGSNVLIDLRVGNDRHLTLPREIQRDHIRGQFLHVDFLAVRRDQTIAVDVPVELVGESHGVKEGGVIEHHLWEIKAECLPADVPDRIEADISRLGIGDVLRVGDLTAPSGVTILSEADETIVSVVPPPIMRLEEEEEAAEVAEAEAEGATAGEAEAGAGAPEEAEQGEEDQG